MNEYDRTVNALPTTKCLGTIKNRPWAVQIGFSILALALLLTSFWYVGAFLLVFCILSIAVTTDYISSKVYENELAVFNPKNQQEIRLIKYEDIISYEYDGRRMSNVVVFIQTGPDQDTDRQAVVIASFQSSRLYRKLKKLIPQKDAAQQRMAQMQGNRLSNKEIKERKRKLKEEKEKAGE